VKIRVHVGGDERVALAGHAAAAAQQIEGRQAVFAAGDGHQDAVALGQQAVAAVGLAHGLEQIKGLPLGARSRRGAGGLAMAESCP
jgi:hypothetical protein